MVVVCLLVVFGFYPPIVHNYRHGMLYGDDINCPKCVFDP